METVVSTPYLPMPIPEVQFWANRKYELKHTKEDISDLSLKKRIQILGNHFAIWEKEDNKKESINQHFTFQQAADM